jgi:hypothetical protein
MKPLRFTGRTRRPSQSAGIWPHGEPAQVRACADGKGTPPVNSTKLRSDPDTSDAQADSDGYHGSGC